MNGQEGVRDLPTYIIFIKMMYHAWNLTAQVSVYLAVY